MAKVKINIEASQEAWDDLHRFCKFVLAEGWGDGRAITVCELFLKIRDTAKQAVKERDDGDVH